MNDEERRRGDVEYRALVKDAARSWWLVMQLEKEFTMPDDTEVRLTELRIKAPTEQGGTYLVIAKGVFERQMVVGFHGADTPHDAIKGACERLNNRSMKWREDKPWKGSE